MSTARGSWLGQDIEASRILFVSHVADRSGAPLLLLWFLRWLRAHTSVRFEVLLLSGGPLEADFAAVAPTHVIDVFGPRPPTLPAEVAIALGREAGVGRRRYEASRRAAAALPPFDVVVLNTGLSGEALGLLPRVPPLVVTWLHDMGTSFAGFLAEHQRSAVLAHTDWFVTCADAVTATLVGQFAVPRRVVRRHHGFIEPPVPDRAGARAIRDQLGVGPDSILVGGAGAIQWRKGPDLLVQVAAAVRRSHPHLDVHFLWAGGADPHGDDVPLAHDIERLGLADRVHLLGSYSSAAAVIGALDVFCLTSREDPFPLVMLEAAGLGVPIVSFANGGVTELAVADGDAERPLAVVVPYLDVEAMATAVAHLADEPDRRADVATRAGAHVRDQLVSDVAAPRLYEDLRDMVAQPVGRGIGAQPGPRRG